jgi:hypothetical protein
MPGITRFFIMVSIRRNNNMKEKIQKLKMKFNYHMSVIRFFAMIFSVVICAVGVAIYSKITDKFKKES